jgi:thioredoxin reductase
MPSIYDGLILGAGPAGLSVALVLSRVHSTAVVFNKQTYRNEGAEAKHNVASGDGIHPAELRHISTKRIKKYGTADFVDTGIVKVQ